MTSSANATKRNLPGRERKQHDFYRTPSWCVTSLYRALPWLFPTPTLDPCAGDGAIIEACAELERGEPVVGVELAHEIVDRAWSAGHHPEVEDGSMIAGIRQGDGLELDWTGQHVIMNPPYNQAAMWCAKAPTADSCCMLVRIGFLGSKKRQQMWCAHPPSALVFLSSRPSFIASGRTDSADYVWCVWSKQWEHDWPSLYWISR